MAAEAISVAMLALVLGFAVVRPWGWGEAVVAVPAAILVIAVGAISPHRALVEAERLGPIIGFLAAVLILAQLCQDEGLFRAYERIEFLAPVQAGDFIEATGVITNVGATILASTSSIVPARSSRMSWQRSWGSSSSTVVAVRETW